MWDSCAILKSAFTVLNTLYEWTLLWQCQSKLSIFGARQSILIQFLNWFSYIVGVFIVVVVNIDFTKLWKIYHMKYNFTIICAGSAACEDGACEPRGKGPTWCRSNPQHVPQSVEWTGRGSAFSGIHSGPRLLPHSSGAGSFLSHPTFHHHPQGAMRSLDWIVAVGQQTDRQIRHIVVWVS